MGENEGQDGEYDATYWENPNLTFPQQSLPSWADFYNAFPKNENNGYITFMNNHDVYNLVAIFQFLKFHHQDQDHSQISIVH